MVCCKHKIEFLHTVVPFHIYYHIYPYSEVHTMYSMGVCTSPIVKYTLKYCICSMGVCTIPIVKYTLKYCICSMGVCTSPIVKYTLKYCIYSMGVCTIPIVKYTLKYCIYSMGVCTIPIVKYTLKYCICNMKAHYIYMPIVKYLHIADNILLHSVGVYYTPITRMMQGIPLIFPPPTVCCLRWCSVEVMTDYMQFHIV